MERSHQETSLRALLEKIPGDSVLARNKLPSLFNFQTTRASCSKSKRALAKQHGPLQQSGLPRALPFKAKAISDDSNNSRYFHVAKRTPSYKFHCIIRLFYPPQVHHEHGILPAVHFALHSLSDLEKTGGTNFKIKQAVLDPLTVALQILRNMSTTFVIAHIVGKQICTLFIAHYVT